MTTRDRSQAGATLLEVMTSLTIGFAVTVPLMAWIVLGLRTTADTEITSSQSRSRNLLGTYLVGDASSATAVSLGGARCSDDPDPASEVLLTVQGAATRAVYTVSTADPERPSAVSVWRRVCDPASTTTSTTRLVDEVVIPAAGWPSVVTCTDRAGLTGDGCGIVAITFETPEGRVIRAAASRRVEGPR